MSMCVDYGDHHEEMIKEYYNDSLEEHKRQIQINKLKHEVEQLKKEMKRAYAYEYEKREAKKINKDRYEEQMREALKSFLHDQEKEELKKELGIEDEFLSKDEMEI